MLMEIKKVGYNKYIFENNNKELFYANQKVRLFQSYKRLYSSENNLLIAEIITKLNFPFKVYYKIKLNDKTKRIIYIKTDKFIPPIYKCKINSFTYWIYPHKGLKTSIFKNNEQIAYYEIQKINIGYKQNIKLYINEDEDIILLSLIVFSLSSNFENQSTVNIDLGNIGSEARKFDKNWTPS